MFRKFIGSKISLRTFLKSCNYLIKIVTWTKEVSLINKALLHISSPDNHQDYAGLVILSGSIVYLDSNSSDNNLEISFNEKEWTLIKTNKTNLSDSFELVINSFLLPQGVNIIYIRLHNSLGDEILKSKITFGVNNTSTLAGSLTECYRDSNDCQLILQGMLDSSNFPYSRCEVVAWFDRQDALDYVPYIVNKYSLPSEFIQHFTNFVNLGYISLDSFIPLNLVAQVNNEIDRLIESGSVHYVSESGSRIEHLFEKSQSVRKIWTYPPIIDILSALFDNPAFPCQTLNFLHGSQQDVHQDSIHLTSFPEGYMCGVWVALENISPHSGPLVVYPKSHKLPVLYAKTVGIDKLNKYWDRHLINQYSEKYLPRIKSDLSELNLEPIEYIPESGSVLIWHANLAHAGSARKIPNLTRKSMVSHYFAQDVISYYDTTGSVGCKHNITTI